MKNSFLKLGVSLIAASSFALADGVFVGFEGGYDFNSKLKLLDESVKDSRPNLGLKAGYDFGIARAYVSYIYAIEAKKDGVKWKNQKFLINGDFTPEITRDIKLIVGVFGGSSAIKAKTGDWSSDAKDALIGARLGAEYSIDKSSAVEFGIRTDYTEYNVEKSDKKVKDTNTGFYLGYNYKF